MSAIAGLIPKIEGFQPIPNAVMIPFMETQSAALAFGFGLNYEYGKRTIRSMSNETFNSLTHEQIAEMSANHSTILLQRFIQAVPQVMPAQTEIFKQYVAIEKLKVLQNFKLAQWTLADLPGILLGLGVDIKDLTKPTPSKIGTSIVQDKFGNVTTTQAPKDISITLKEEIGVTATIEPPPPPTVVNLNPKLVAHYENNVKVLELKLKQETIKMNNSVSQAAKNQHKLTINTITIELAQQRRFLANVKRGQNPY